MGWFVVEGEICVELTRFVVVTFGQVIVENEVVLPVNHVQPVQLLLGHDGLVDADRRDQLQGLARDQLWADLSCG